MLPPNRGAALLEVIVALGVTSVGVLAVLASVPAASRLETLASRRTRAVLVITDRLERLRAVPGCPPAGVGHMIDSATPLTVVDWQVSPAGPIAEVQVFVRVPMGRDTVRDSIRAVLPCG